MKNPCKLPLVPVAALLFLLLPGCSPMKKAINPYEENFKCRAADDTGKCIDTPTAYREARYPAPDGERRGPGTTGPRQRIQDQRYRTVAGLLRESRKPLLLPPKILRVLLLPYRGEKGELFMGRYIYVRIEESRWILTDLTEGGKTR